MVITGAAFLIGLAIFILVVMVIINLMSGKSALEQAKSQTIISTFLEHFRFQDALIYTFITLGLLQLLTIILGIQTINSITPPIRMTIFVGVIAIIMYAQSEFVEFGRIFTREGKLTLQAAPTIFIVYMSIAALALLLIGIFLPNFLSSFRQPIQDTMTVVGQQTMSIIGIGG